LNLTIDAAGYYTAHSTMTAKYSRQITPTEYADAHVDAMNAGTSIQHELEYMMRAELDMILTREGYATPNGTGMRQTHDATHDGKNPRCPICTPHVKLANWRDASRI